MPMGIDQSWNYRRTMQVETLRTLADVGGRITAGIDDSSSAHCEGLYQGLFRVDSIDPRVLDHQIGWLREQAPCCQKDAN